MTEQITVEPSADGRADFDFFFGRWHGAIRKLADVTDRNCTEWVEFEATCDCGPILAGLGNFETAVMHPGGQTVQGATLRLFTPSTRTWRIWWMSSRLPGVLDAPVEGRFEGDRGIFEGPDEFDGTPILVRYEWDRLSADEVRWAQRFSWDGGATWDDLNWVTMWTRIV
ncbi:hypothetical protein [Hamadaea tsunoensis]|uniref:hypothetical protein n=1 Tax=Hamadaea tsunoensis TaxID=53368 RepID=UPI000410115D|nr:hypothetical protein [Hamadaea tsunoensis]